MKHIIFIFKDCALFEVMLLANFLKSQGEEVVIVGEEKIVTVHEGFNIQTDLLLDDVNIDNVKSFTITGGNPNNLKNKSDLGKIISRLYKNDDKIIGGICGGVYIIGELLNIDNNRINTLEVTIIDNLVVSPPNKYVDFAIKMLEVMNLYNDDEDYQETVRFFKEFKSE
ncbi:DJ-1/PfpI family protein [Mammaliicoccus sciuri]|uniref:DJ-1/PfpI family protein n=1 Tax=Mammaliicoccus sciuri TaxID=1296 RepID=UPI0034DD6C66